MARKAQGMPMNVIIVAAIALIVLVVISFIFVTKSKSFSTAASGCKEKGGDCYKLENCKGPNLGKMDCPDDKPFCCLTV